MEAPPHIYAMLYQPGDMGAVVFSRRGGGEKVRAFQPLQELLCALPADGAIINIQKFGSRISFSVHVLLLIRRDFITPGVPAVSPLAGE